MEFSGVVPATLAVSRRVIITDSPSAAARGHPTKQIAMELRDDPLFRMRNAPSALAA